MKRWAYIICAFLFLWLVGTHPAMLGAHMAPAPQPVQQTSGDCTVHVIATDGTPPPGTPRLDPAKLCDALHRAEQQAGH